MCPCFEHRGDVLEILENLQGPLNHPVSACHPINQIMSVCLGLFSSYKSE